MECAENHLAYINSYKNADAIVLPPRVPLVIKLLGCVVPDHQSVLGELFVETLLGSAVEKEVKRLGHLGQGTQAQEREKGSHGVGCTVWCDSISSQAGWQALRPAQQ